MSGMGEVFGELPTRPNTPDFWRLSELRAGPDPEGPDGSLQGHVGEGLDVDMSAERRLEHPLLLLRGGRCLHGPVQPQNDLAANFKEAAKLSAIYIDGFTTGCEYTRHD